VPLAASGEGCRRGDVRDHWRSTELVSPGGAYVACRMVNCQSAPQFKINFTEITRSKISFYQLVGATISARRAHWATSGWSIEAQEDEHSA